MQERDRFGMDVLLRGSWRAEKGFFLNGVTWSGFSFSVLVEGACKGSRNGLYGEEGSSLHVSLQRM